MAYKAENHLLFRRFMWLTLVVMVLAVLLAQLLQATGKNSYQLVIHDRPTIERSAITEQACVDDDRLCAVPAGLASGQLHENFAIG